MADEQLRRAQRTFLATPSLQDEERLLLQRFRSGELSEGRVRLLGELGCAAAASLAAPSSLLPEVGDSDFWTDVGWWFDALKKLDPSALLTAGVIVGEMLLPFCESEDHSGDLQRIVQRLGQALPGRDGSCAEVLSDLRARIEEINQVEGDLDSGTAMPTERVAARAVSHLGLEFAGGRDDGWLAGAALGLFVCRAGSAETLMDELRSRLVRRLLGPSQGG